MSVKYTYFTIANCYARALPIIPITYIYAALSVSPPNTFLHPAFVAEELFCAVIYDNLVESFAVR